MASSISKHSLVVTVHGRTWTFTLDRKLERFGELEIDHLWIPTPQLNPVGEAAPDSMFRSFCESYRNLCMTEVSDLAQAAETYALARLLPHTRKRGAMAVFMDAKESKETHKLLRGNDEELQGLLERDPLAPMTVTEFDAAMQKLQERQFSEGQRERYIEITEELLGDVHELWWFGHRPEAAHAAVLGRWTDLMKRIGRRRGCETEKAVLDCLSYEAAAAFRRCYSAAWSAYLLPRLQEELDLSRYSYRYLEYFHQQIIVAQPGAVDHRLHPFHGHCFALHPATGRFLKTGRGRELVGEWLQVAVMTGFTSEAAYHTWQTGISNSPEFGRLLRGFYLAYWHYSSQRDSANSDRPYRTGSLTPDD